MNWKLINHLIQFFFRKLIELNIRSPKCSYPKIVLAYSEWLFRKGYLEISSEEDVARSFGVSRTQLSSFCRIRLGSDFRQLRKEYRIREAKLLMKENPNLTLDILGECVGIPDRSNFRKQFMEVEGCSPSEWLKAQGRR